MVTNSNQTYVYIGLAGESEQIGEGGLYRRPDGDERWESITNGLPTSPQVRALLVHPQTPEILYAGTQLGPYRSDDRGDHWRALNAPRDEGNVWSLAFHPQDPDVIYIGYDPCAIYRSEDGGSNWRQMNTKDVVFPHITTYMPPLGKRVIEIASDPSNPMDMYAAVEVGGLLASRDGGENWASIIDGPYVGNSTLDLHGVQVSPAAAGIVFIVTQIAMFRSRDRGHRWEHVQMDEMFAGGSYCRDLLVVPDEPRTLYLAAGAGGGSAMGVVEKGALFRSLDVGETWEKVELGDTPSSRMYQVAIARTTPARVYCCTGTGAVYGSQDGGNAWSKSQVPGEMSRGRHVYSMVCG